MGYTKCPKCGKPAHPDDSFSLVNCKTAARARICRNCGHRKGRHRDRDKGCFGDMPIEVMMYRTAPGPCDCNSFEPEDV
jgi:ribosomal protein L32